MWNRGVQAARDGGYQAVAILNDDIRIHPGTITLLAEPLLAYPTLGVVYPHWPISLDTPLPTRVKRLEASLSGRALAMGVDRLDYSKGLPERFRAFERYLQLAPDAPEGPKIRAFLNALRQQPQMP